MPGENSLLAVNLTDCLPADWREGLFIGRVLTAAGPSPILVDKGIAYDMSQVAPTVAHWPKSCRWLQPPVKNWGRSTRSLCRCSARSICNASRRAA